MRGPWHDIGSSLVGKAAAMVGRHFIERWNNAIYTCFKASTKIKIQDKKTSNDKLIFIALIKRLGRFRTVLLSLSQSRIGLRRYRIPAIGDEMPKQYLLPRVISTITQEIEEFCCGTELASLPVTQEIGGRRICSGKMKGGTNSGHSQRREQRSKQPCH